MVLPAVLVVLAFAVFPLIVSLYLSLIRFAIVAGGFKLTFVGLFNYNKLLFGSQQYHLVGTFGAFGVVEWTLAAIALAAILYWLARSPKFPILGFVGRLIASAVAFGCVLIALATIVAAGGFPGSIVTISSACISSLEPLPAITPSGLQPAKAARRSFSSAGTKSGYCDHLRSAKRRSTSSLMRAGASHGFSF